MRVCARAHVNVCVRVCERACMCVYMGNCVSLHVCMCVCVCVNESMQVFACTCVHATVYNSHQTTTNDTRRQCLILTAWSDPTKEMALMAGWSQMKFTAEINHTANISK